MKCCLYSRKDNIHLVLRLQLEILVAFTSEAHPEDTFNIFQVSFQTIDGSGYSSEEYIINAECLLHFQIVYYPRFIHYYYSHIITKFYSQLH